MPLIHLLTSFEGRIGRIAFWGGTALVALALLGVERAAAHLDPDYATQIVTFAGTFALFPWAALAAKRASERGRPPLYGAVLVVAIVLLGLASRFADAGAGRLLDTLSLTLWLTALIDLGLLPAGDARKPVAEAEAGAKPAQ
ncbi:hypothetical protein DWF00_17520 [Bosea caraganae]|uniref:DUF805 domain-containing protein n=1 Tax=Bosea caraganae TaxID=2763117 RepID=A0A370L7V0_9HYPH|nr:hypothetical protein [Bosea caraganae]RDJ25007.1 hypothetical protein DWF00_17520 [Bosea caraganae]RDJ26117.1 hypothetical protein DWE98_09740 [Bosea caraganae]